MEKSKYADTDSKPETRIINNKSTHILSPTEVDIAEQCRQMNHPLYLAAMNGYIAIIEALICGDVQMVLKVSKSK